MVSSTEHISGGLFDESQFGSLMTPLYLTSTFVLDGVGKDKGYDYTRTGNPTRTALQNHLAQIEGGAGCSVHGTGIASISTVLHHFQKDDHILVTQDCYGGTHRLIHQNLVPLGLDATFCDFGNLDEVKHLIKASTKAVWVESPTNPLLKLFDLQAIGKLCKEHGLLFIVDNTFLSPVGQRPFDFGADLVVHSTTKYINGHCDTLGGAVISRTQEWAERIDWLTNCLGTGQSPFDCWAILRGAKTLEVRFKTQCDHATTIARWLEDHPIVKRVHFPGLESHPQYHLAQSQQKTPGAMIAFEVEGGAEQAKQVVENTKVVRLAESLGGVQSLIEVPALQSHASMTPEARDAAGISESLIRLSVGLESPHDLIEDLDQALQTSQKHSSQTVLTEVH